MTIIVVCVAASATELIARARAIAQAARVISLCTEADGDNHAYIACGADEIVCIPYRDDPCAQGTLIADALKKLQPDAALFPATVRGRFLSAWAAAKLQTGLTADCTGLSLTEEGNLLQTRPAFGGNLTAQILCKNHRPQMASVRPGVFPPAVPTECEANIPLRAIPLQTVKRFLEPVAFTPSEDIVPLQSAGIVVTGGKGIGGKSGFETLSELARLLGGALGATRGAVDAGWIGYAHQVGQTGVAVRPKLYLAFGVSGMVQHIAGMNGAETVIAVNNDRLAPIFDYADYGIVADWRETAETMIRYLKERKEEK